MIVKHLYNGDITISFDERSHTYIIDGNRIPSVSTISSIGSKGDILTLWALKLVREYLNKNKDELITDKLIKEALSEYKRAQLSALSVGTETHKWCEDVILRRIPKTPSCEEVDNATKAFLKWNKSYRSQFEYSELMLYSRKYNYVGIVDVVFTVDGFYYIGDFKTSKAIYPEYFIQIAGYVIAFEEEYGIKIEGACVIRLDKKTGEYEVKYSKDLKRDKECFLSCLNIKNTLKDIKDEQAVEISTTIVY